MKKIIIASDSFKGSLSSKRIAELAEQTIHQLDPEIQVFGIPISDGGEGLIEAAEASGFCLLDTPAYDPYFTPRNGRIACRGAQAVVELADCSGLLLCHPADPSLTSTYGTGLQLKVALERGCTDLMLGLGGSGTHDGGCGIAAALGVKFLHEGEAFLPVGETLTSIDAIDLSGVDPRLARASLTCLCDVLNPAVGPLGAAQVFAAQKGADATMIARLEDGTRHLAQQIRQLTGSLLMDNPSTGAAGACGLGLCGLLHAKIENGLSRVLSWNRFEEQLKDADLVITGEGCIDSQSRRGKVPLGILERTRPHSIRVLALCGKLKEDPQLLKQDGFLDVLAISPEDLPLKQAMAEAESRYQATLKAWLISALNH